MLKSRGALLGCITVATWFVVSCADSTAPTQSTTTVRPQAQRDALLGELLNTVSSLLIAPVQRKQALTDDVSWSFYAGPNGGATVNAALGVAIVIPPGALESTQRITVTALKGSAVAYSFSPHLEFDRNVSITQDLRVTKLDGALFLPLLSGAHFVGDVLQLKNGLALVDEIVAALVLPWTKTVTFQVDHFSGWIVASGRSSGGN